MKKWLLFGLFGGLLNFIMLFVAIGILVGGDTPGNIYFAIDTTILPGLGLWVFGGFASGKKYMYSTVWVVIFSILTIILWGFSIVFVTSYLR